MLRFSSWGIDLDSGKLGGEKGNMILKPLLPVLLFLYLTSFTAHGQGLKESFYNEVRQLLLNLPKQPRKSGPETPVEVVGWGDGLESILGQITGVSVNSLGQPVVFHRGPRIWDKHSFNSSHHFQGTIPISVDTIVVIDPRTGSMLSSWGGGLFYLPHGLTVDHGDNVWVTDVAMHQVHMFPAGWKFPLLSLGELFNPGSGRNQFCQPTSVAVATTREIFVADGYCNSRIMKFNRKGHLIRIFPQNDEFLSLVVPHSVSLIEERDILCVSDRENMRVACFRAELKDSRPNTTLSPFTIHQPDFGRVFAIAAKGDYVYAVNGPTSPMIPIQGFTIDPFSEMVVDHWTPVTKGFSNPHDIAVSPFGEALYVSEIGPNKLWKFNLESPESSNIA